MGSSSLSIANFRFEQRASGLGIHVTTPRLSWHIDAPAGLSNWMQTGYQVQVSRRRKRNGETLSFGVQSPDTVLIPWPDTPLNSLERAHVRVRSFGTSSGTPADTEWSDWFTVEASILDEDSWIAKPITSPTDLPGGECSAENGFRPMRFRKVFDVPEKAARSRLYITALGLYEARLNGRRIGDECLAPGWTTYDARLQFQAFDISSFLVAGTNILVVDVAEGWYAGRLLWGEGKSRIYGDRIGPLAQLALFDSDAASTPSRWIVTDETWECKPQATTSSSLYDGETYNLGLEYDPWDLNDSGWSPAEVLEPVRSALVPSSCDPVRVTQVVRPVSISKDPDGKALVDFGQNLVGRVRIPLLARPDGHQLVMRFAEVLEEGRLGVRPLRQAKVTDTVIFAGGRQLENWAPRFTYHGFRYVEVSGWHPDDTEGPLTLDSLVAEVLHTDMRRTGHFACSDERVTRLHQNVLWSMRGNFVGLPTDCPQRDERLGWTGDIQVFSPTASYIYDCSGMLANWLRDVVAEQAMNGGIVPLVIPNVMRDGPWPTVPQAVWDDVIIILPWNLYRNFGDAQVLRDNWPAMESYLRSVRRASDGLWDPALWQLGDWLDPAAPPHEPGLSRTDGVLVADQYLVHVTSLMAKIASVLGHADSADMYTREHARLKQTFQDKYMAKSGLVVGDSQTSLSLSMRFDLHATPEQRKVAGDRLARLARYAGFRISTGFAGTPAVLEALTQGGHSQLAYRMLLEESCPSWLYPVSQGASTIWERWDSMLEDGRINPGEMTSFNHYALGSVADWLHRTVAGLSLLEPGWKKVLVSPKPGGTITSAQGRFESPHGTISCRWELVEDNRMVRVHLTIPPNVQAVVDDPRGEYVVGSGRHIVDWPLPKEEEAWPPQKQVIAFGM
ncbi:alfa-L-rhamnosidase [Emericellopsis atlantica]|uniref:alpha-L-rhamnosidase n=1 Tax=Emericellopsis atlantica TaxID=2614577 RepID=A0A9P7ZJ48_9HYPO|nr:alfa-L-rhamnosidase [Emericellopsis atlantica]KAG9252712.1 alfa-L-rhamnosidase [Emericellopsis atlantica]